MYSKKLSQAALEIVDEEGKPVCTMSDRGSLIKTLRDADEIVEWSKTGRLLKDSKDEENIKGFALDKERRSEPRTNLSGCVGASQGKIHDKENVMGSPMPQEADQIDISEMSLYELSILKHNLDAITASRFGQK